MIAAFSPASFQHFASVCCRHTRSKTVHAHTAADFWLIGSLGHFTSYSLVKFPLNRLVEPGFALRCPVRHALNETRLYRMLRFLDSFTDMNLINPARSAGNFCKISPSWSASTGRWIFLVKLLPRMHNNLKLGVESTR